ncbi:phosphoglycolate phosphatase [Sulfuriflexus mobilis]|uniref:phosphoglycolate phosphatase n=1 Tax=Sulfuriflexus mobilis TaxID=1811807 RepID=UPI000F828B9D|nr:phosphoglycolate phosphatase [Sulfuriflexus mobilis]
MQTILFDLDGTLLDTAPDLAAALNQVLVENRREALPFETIRPWVSHGGQALISRGFQIEMQDPAFEPLRQRLLEVYRANIANQTRLFPGMGPVLDELEARQLKWGVVTNKPGWLTEPLLEQLDLHTRCACIVSGDTLTERKPHPAPLLHACILTGSRIEDCLYIGDAQRDIEAARNARMPNLVALFGYLGDEDRPQDWQADGMLEQPHDLLDWLDARHPG